MSAKTYLHVPGVFGFHGVYKPLARHLGVIDDEMRLGDNGYALLKVWQEEQELSGFLESSVVRGPGTSFRQLLRSAVEDGLSTGHTTRSGSWQGWNLLANHLAPGTIAPLESACLHQLLLDRKGGTRGEIFLLLRNEKDIQQTEAVMIRSVLEPQASPELRHRLSAIAAFEAVGTLLEDAFDWIRYLSSAAGARAITPDAYAQRAEPRTIAAALSTAFRRAEDALAASPLSLQQYLASLAKSFDGATDAGRLFECILSHHGEVQKAKKPDGKREWFERGDKGATFVRVPYRVTGPPQPRDWWSRPYRVSAAQSFLRDLFLGAA